MSILPDIEFEPDVPGSFLGKGLAWPYQEDPETGDYKRVADEESVASCLIFLLETSYGEIPLDETFGTRVQQLLFNNDLVGIEELVTESIERAIREKEQRVQLIRTQFEVRRHQQNPNRIGINALLVYRVKATGDVAKLVHPFNITTRTVP